MKMIKKIIKLMRKVSGTLLFAVLPNRVFAEGRDLLASALSDEIQGSLGSGATFWKVFILVDIILATAMAVKSKNPMVFVGVTAIAFIPAFLLKTFVF